MSSSYRARLRMYNMRSVLSICVWSLCGLTAAAAGTENSTCTFQPIQVPVTNVSLSNGGSLRGITIGVGSPAQMFAMDPQASLNTTYVLDQGTLGSYGCANRTTCIVMAGGQFTNSSSSSWAQLRGGLYSNADTDPNVNAALLDAYGADTLTLNSKTSLQQFPIGVATIHGSDAIVNRAGLGLGRKSTLLSQLQASSLIASRSWSFFFGWNGGSKNYQMDGSLVLGGYDAAKITPNGQNYTQPLGSGAVCSNLLDVTISDVIMNFPNGTDHSIVGRQNSFRACLAPEFPSIVSLPNTSFDDFEAWSSTKSTGRSVWYYFWDMLYASTNVYAGDLTIELSAQIRIRVPNHQLVVPYAIVALDGRQSVNQSSQVLLINELLPPNHQDTLILGREFFSSAYLTVNYDTNTFTVAQANATTNSNLVPIYNSSTTRDQLCNVSSIQTTMTASSSATSNQPSSISGGAIAGIVIAALSGIALLAAGAFFLRRRSKKRKQAGQPSNNPPEDRSHIWHDKDRPYDVAPQEMPVSGDAQHLDSTTAYKPSTYKAYSPQQQQLMDGERITVSELST